jgi:hypothetical protein
MVSHPQRRSRLRVFENRVLRRIFGRKREEVAEDWRRLHNEELHNLYASPNIIRVIISRRKRLAGYVACMGDEKCLQNANQKPEGKRPLDDLHMGVKILF